MKKNVRRLAVVAAAAALLAPAAVASAAPCTGVATGPSSSQSPYLLPIAKGVTNTSLLTVGDKAANGYQMVGVADGLGAYDNGDGTITVLMNHELGAKEGAVHAHGATGAFVSEWVIDKRTLKVLKGADLIQKLALHDPNLPKTIARLCSADLPKKSAFFNPKTGKGYNGRIFLNGEEDPASGRAFAHVATGSEKGTSYELSAMGNASWENLLANPATGDSTVVIGTDDATPGQIYVYVGQKRTRGSAIDKAGLTGGKLYGIKAMGGQDEYDEKTKGPNKAFPLKGTFELAQIGNRADYLNYKETERLSDKAHVTQWWRPEDGAWDVKNPNVFYFTATGSFGVQNRVWKLTFADIQHPERGGTVEAVIDGTEGTQMVDNMAASADGKSLIINEDTGNNEHLARVFSYDLNKDKLTAILQHDPARFAKGGARFLTIDEESSGTIDASEFFGKGAYLMVTQAHYDNGPTLVEGGQLQLVRVPKNLGKK